MKFDDEGGMRKWKLLRDGAWIDGSVLGFRVNAAE